jgi:hypothetical protein
MCWKALLVGYCTEALAYALIFSITSAQYGHNGHKLRLAVEDITRVSGTDTSEQELHVEHSQCSNWIRPVKWSIFDKVTACFVQSDSRN